ncbi:MAG: acyl carrier protein [Acidimicrobiales bacterium]
MTTLTVDQARTVVVGAITTVAPEVSAEIDALDPTVDLWDALGLDSMDHLNVMTELAERTGVEIPERDYGRLRSVAALAEHLAGATA